MGGFSKDKTPAEEGFTEFDKFFTFLRNLGAGGFGKVVLAKSLKDGKEYAVKVSPSCLE